MAAKIRWLKRHDASVAAAARFHQPVSYLVERLTGRAVMDHALASTTMVYAIDRRGFDAASSYRSAIVVYALLVGPLGVPGSAELALLSWLSGAAFILLVETSPV